MSRRQFDRTSRVASLLREVIATAVTLEIKDPAVKGVTITDVEITGDLREAKVFFVTEGDEARVARARRGLERASGYLRRLLGQRVQMRTTPTLIFKYDPSLDYGARIDRALAEIKQHDAEVASESKISEAQSSAESEGAVTDIPDDSES
ncbi:MAG: 30S ribosome-binding factor RbfA [Bradymonadia bacterium]